MRSKPLRMHGNVNVLWLKRARFVTKGNAPIDALYGAVGALFAYRKRVSWQSNNARYGLEPAHGGADELLARWY